MTNPTTTRTRDTLIEMFLDGTAGEVYADGRLATVENEIHGGVDLIAFGKYRLATYNEHTDIVRVFTGHYGVWSKTVSRYLTFIQKVADNHVGERNVVESPNRAPVLSGHVGEVAEAAQYIDNYIRSYEGMSAVEKNAYETVNAALRTVVRHLL